MTEKTTKAQTPDPGVAGNTAVPRHGDRDRVAMLSLNADGTPAQVDPELVGDRQDALDATRRQFAEQAVSARDTELRATTETEAAGEVAEDPATAELRREHQEVEKAALSAADATVDALRPEA